MGWSNTVSEPAFGASSADASIKSKLINLMTSVRTLMRSEFMFFLFEGHGRGGERKVYTLMKCSTADCDKFDFDCL